MGWRDRIARTGVLEASWKDEVVGVGGVVRIGSIKLNDKEGLHSLVITRITELLNKR